MCKQEIALRLTLAVLDKEDDRVLSNDSDRSAKKVGTSAAELFNAIFAALDIPNQEA